LTDNGLRLTDDEIREAYRALTAREETARREYQNRHARNERLFYQYQLAIRFEGAEPVVLEGVIESRDSECYYADTHYLEAWDDYVDKLPEGVEVRLTVEVTGPKFDTTPVFECEAAGCGQLFEWGMYAERNQGWIGLTEQQSSPWIKERTYLCLEHVKSEGAKR
jgi:hypothetical protein